MFVIKQVKLTRGRPMNFHHKWIKRQTLRRAKWGKNILIQKQKLPLSVLIALKM